MQDIGKARQLSLAASLLQFEQASAAVLPYGVDVVSANEGHHWRFVYKKKTILNFWPASAKGQRPNDEVFRCKGWKHAVDITFRVLEREGAIKGRAARP